jgi:hypothetical protein
MEQGAVCLQRGIATGLATSICISDEYIGRGIRARYGYGIRESDIPYDDFSGYAGE